MSPRAIFVPDAPVPAKEAPPIRPAPLVLAVLVWILLPVQTSLLPPLLPPPLRPDLMLAIALSLAWLAPAPAALSAAAILGLVRDTQTIGPFGMTALATLGAAAIVLPAAVRTLPRALPRFLIGASAGAIYLSLLWLLDRSAAEAFPLDSLLPFALAQGAGVLLLFPLVRATRAAT